MELQRRGKMYHGQASIATGRTRLWRLQEPHLGGWDCNAKLAKMDRRREEPQRVGAGLAGDARVLAEEHGDVADMHPDERHGLAGRHHRGLRVHAQQVVLPR